MAAKARLVLQTKALGVVLASTRDATLGATQHQRLDESHRAELMVVLHDMAAKGNRMPDDMMKDAR